MEWPDVSKEQDITWGERRIVVLEAVMSKEPIYSTSNPIKCKAVAFKFHILYLKEKIYLKVIIYILEKNSLLSWNNTLTTCSIC